MSFGMKAPQWFGRVAFTDDGHRHVYRAHDYIQVSDGTYYQLQQCFVHVYQRRRYVFFIARNIQPEFNQEAEQIENEVLGLKLYSLDFTQKIFGLPAMQSTQPYFIQVCSTFYTGQEADILPRSGMAPGCRIWR